MTQFDKMYKKIMEDPIHADLDIDEIKNFLKKLGFEHRIKGTSHNIFTHQDYPGIIVVPTKHGRHVKGVYIKKIREAIIEIE